MIFGPRVLRGDKYHYIKNFYFKENYKMANINKLVKAFEAFNNKNQNAATQLFRSFFVESAQEINSKLDEEDFGDADMGDDLESDVGYELDEAASDEVDPELQDQDVDPAGIDRPADDFPIDGEQGDDEVGADPEFGADDEFGADADAEPTEVPDADEWAEITAAYDDLAALFADMGVTPDNDEVDASGEDEFGDDFSADQPEADGIEFDEPVADDEDPLLGEDYGFDVPEFNNADQASSTKSVVASQATPVIDGADIVEIKSTKSELGNPAVKVDDQSNIQKTGKDIYRTASEPGATKDTTSSKSPVRPLK